MLRAERLGKRFGERWVFRGVEFELRAGDRLVVLGANGSGKSTLLAAVAGLLPPSEGRVSLPDGPLGLAVGFAALSGELYPELTCAEHLGFVADWRGCPARTDELLELVGLAPARDQQAARLSSGMRARLRLAIALQPRPAVLVLDEPSAGLDAQGRDVLARVVAAQSERGAVLLATNDPDERKFATHELSLG